MVSMIRRWDVLGNDGTVAQPTWLPKSRFLPAWQNLCIKVPKAGAWEPAQAQCGADERHSINPY